MLCLDEAGFLHVGDFECLPLRACITLLGLT